MRVVPDIIYSVPMGATIRVVVGPSKQDFTIHEHLAKSKSKYFSTALSQWQKVQQRTFELPEENVPVFAGFVNYLYSGGVKFNRSAPDIDIELFLIMSYLLGERRGCMSFRNAVLDVLASIWTLGRHPSTEAIMLTFSESMEKSTLRRYIVDKCAWDATVPVRKAVLEDTLEEETAPGFQNEFLKALLLRDEARNSGFSKLPPYHTDFDLKYHEYEVNDGE